MESRLQAVHHHATQEPTLPARDICQGSASQAPDVAQNVPWQYTLTMRGDVCYSTCTYVCVIVILYRDVSIHSHVYTSMHENQTLKL